MKGSAFAPEELADLAAFDAAVDAEPDDNPRAADRWQRTGPRRRDPEVAALVGRGIARRRHGAGLSRRTLAAGVGCHPSLVYQIETGRQLPTITTLYALARALGCPPGDLLPTPDGEAGRAADAA